MIDFSYTLAGAFTGFVVGLTGVGGGALMTPILLLVFDIVPTVAIATDLWFASLTKIATLPIHHKAIAIDWQVVRRLWLGSLPCALCVVVYLHFYGNTLNTLWLIDAVAFAILITAVGLVFAPWFGLLAKKRMATLPLDFSQSQPILTVCAGLFLGFLVSTTSIGAGAIGSILLLSLYPIRLTPQKLVGSDLAHAIPLALLAGSGYLIAGQVNGSLLLSLLLGSVPMAMLGSLLTHRLPSRLLQLVLAFMLSVIALKMLVL